MTVMSKCNLNYFAEMTVICVKEQIFSPLYFPLVHLQRFSRHILKSNYVELNFLTFDGKVEIPQH